MPYERLLYYAVRLTQQLRHAFRDCRMPCAKIALTLLILSSAAAWSANAQAGNAPAPTQIAQAPAAPTPRAAQHPAAPDAQPTAGPVGSVATLEGSATVTRNNATTPVQLRD